VGQGLRGEGGIEERELSPRPHGRYVRLFVVYAAEDNEFVEGFLLPAVGLDEEAVLRSTRLDPGAPIVEEIARGALSPVTVLVMSPSFLASPWANLANQLATHRSVEESKEGLATVVPVLVKECAAPLLTRLRVSLDFRRPERAHWEEEVERLRKLLARQESASAAAEERCPYPGMLAFDAKSAQDFYGRTAEVAEALAHLRGGVRELYVIGPSGSGKSSLVAAGIVPQLQRNPVLAGGRYLVCSMRPGGEPVQALAAALDAKSTERPPRWSTVVEELLARSEEHDRVLLFVDQLEELFTTATQVARKDFEAALRQLREDPHVTLVLTLRADFYGSLMESALWRQASRGRPLCLDVAPLHDAALRAAIEEPARALSVYYEPVLVERLLQEVEHEVGALPLLQDTLLQLWHQRTRQLVRLADYESLGAGGQTGLVLVMRQRADAAMRKLTEEQQLLAKRTLLRLVQLGEEDTDLATRRQQTLAALSAPGDGEGAVNAVVQHLADHRLVTTSGGNEQEGWGRVDLAHEVLLSAWPTLAEWIRTRRVDEQRRRLLEGKAREWVASGKGKTRLLDAEELSEVRGWLTQKSARELGTSEDAMALVAAAAAARSRRTRFLIVALVASVAVVSTFVQIMRQQSAATRHELGLNLQEQARSLLVEGSVPSRAIGPLLQAIELNVEGAALRTLLASLRSRMCAVAFFHQGAVSVAVFSPDGSRVVTASADGIAQVWDVRTGRAVGGPLVHKQAIHSAAFSSDGTRVVTASWDKTAQVWDTATGQRLIAPFVHNDGVTSAVFSPDGLRVVTASWDGTVAIWNAETGAKVQVVLAHRQGVNKVAFSLDGLRIVTAGNDNTARVWDARTGSPAGPPLAHGREVMSAVFSPDGSRVVTASWDKTAQVWSSMTGRPLGKQLTHQGAVWSAAFSPDGSRVVTGSSDGARLWDATTGIALEVHPRHAGQVVSAVFSPDGERVVTASGDGTSRVWDAANGQPLTAPLVHESGVVSAVFSPDGSQVVTASNDGTARVWDAGNGGFRGVLLTHKEGVRDASFSPEGNRVVTAGDDRAARVWDARTGQPTGVVLSHEGKVSSAVFSPDGSSILTASEDRTAQLWDAKTGRAIGGALMSRGRLWNASFSPDGARVVTASENQEAQIWEVSTGLPIGSPVVHRGGVRRAVFSPDGLRILTAGADMTARVWDAATGKQVGMPLLHDDGIMSAAYSPDGKRVVTAGGGAAARMWEVATGRAVGTPLVHEDSVRDAAFSPDGMLVVTASKDGTARLWDVMGRPLVSSLAHGGDVRSVAFSPDGSRVVTASADKTARIWDVVEKGSLSLWSAQAKRCVARLRGNVSSARCPLSQREATFEDTLARARSLSATGDAKMRSQVLRLPRSAYQQALAVLDEGIRASSSTDRLREDALRESISLRLAIVDAMEGDLSQARARYPSSAPDARLLSTLGVIAHEVLYDDLTAIALLRKAAALAPEDLSTLCKLAEVHFAAGDLTEATSIATKINVARASPDQRVALAALAWGAARLTSGSEAEQAATLARAYAALPDTARSGWPWTGTMHALAYGRYSAEESQPVLDVLRVLEGKASAEARARLASLLAPKSAPPGPSP
jgi:WD40 repeat protein